MIFLNGKIKIDFCAGGIATKKLIEGTLTYTHTRMRLTDGRAHYFIVNLIILKGQTSVNYFALQSLLLLL